MKAHLKAILSMLAAAVVAVGIAGPAQAQDGVLERAKAGKPIRIGFSNEAPYAFPGSNGEAKGFVNVVGLEVLERMGISNVETVVTEWGSLIPGLNANRFDIITGGMYILPKRCKNVAFTEPMGEFAEAFMVKKGNPMDLHSFEDVKNNSNAILVTGAGYSTVDHAKRIGIPEDRIMQVPDPAAMLQAVKAGRAHAASATVFAMKDLVSKGGGDVEMAKPFSAPDFTKGYSAFAFRQNDRKSVDEFNKVMAEYLGTPEMLAAVEEYAYGEDQLPPASVTAATLCEE